MTTVVLASAADMPKPDPETERLAGALTELGVRAEIQAWDGIGDRSDVDLVVIRTTWDYPARLAEFLGWCHSMERVARLTNPVSVVEWNSHKSYLLDLEAAGVPIVPTVLLNARNGPGIEVVSRFAEGELVAKPAVSNNAIGAVRGTFESVASHVTSLLVNGDALVQPFVPSVLDRGEISLMFFRGEFSHGVRKIPRSGEFRVQDHHGGSVQPHAATPSEREVALAAVRCAPAPTTYARVDLVETAEGPAVMELELIQPELFLDSSTATRFARVLVDESG